MITIKSYYTPLRKALNCVERVSRRLSEVINLFEERVRSIARTEGVATLPSEILAMVFIFVLEDANTPSTAVLAASKLSHVSRTWREIAVNTPQLWTRIELWTSLDQVHASLERSKAVPIHISLTPGIDYYALRRPSEVPVKREGLLEAVAVATTHAHRWKSFQWVSIAQFEYHDEVVDYFRNMVPNGLVNIRVPSMKDLVFPLPSSVYELSFAEPDDWNFSASFLRCFNQLRKLSCHVHLGMCITIH